MKLSKKDIKDLLELIHRNIEANMDNPKEVKRLEHLERKTKTLLK